MPSMQVYPLDQASAVPPFEQLRTQIASRAASGELPAGTRMPTVRALAGELRLAVNTVAKAYRALETDGVIATEGRRGTFISATAAGARPGPPTLPRRTSSLHAGSASRWLRPRTWSSRPGSRPAVDDGSRLSPAPARVSPTPISTPRRPG